MTASVTLFNAARFYMGNSTFGDVTARTWKVTLHTSAFAPTTAMQVYANLTNELPTNFGYTNGGYTLTGMTWGPITSPVVNMQASPALAQWAAVGGSIAARYAVIRAVGTLNSFVDPLLLWYLLDTTPADVTATSGNTLQIAFNAAGIFQIA